MRYDRPTAMRREFHFFFGGLFLLLGGPLEFLVIILIKYKS